jgi:ABC-type phosphate/phosphonate transport system permease subunit
MKRVLVYALGFALAFAVLSTWLGPKAIGWYVTPADQPAMLSCNAAVVGAMHRLVMTQLWGTVVGAVLGVVIGILMARRGPPSPAPTKTA